MNDSAATQRQAHFLRATETQRIRRGAVAVVNTTPSLVTEPDGASEIATDQLFQRRKYEDLACHHCPNIIRIAGDYSSGAGYALRNSGSRWRLHAHPHHSPIVNLLWASTLHGSAR